MGKFLKRAAFFLGLALVYFIAGKLGLKLAFVQANATAVWPPTGIALAAYLIWGYRVFPAIFLGAFLTNITTAGSVATSLGIATGNALEGLVGAYLVNRFAGGREAFEHPQNTFKFAVLAGLVATTVSATFGVTSLALGSFAEWSKYFAVWLTWWLGDMGGALIVAPLLILWITNPRLKWNTGKALEIGLLISSILFFGIAIFGRVFPFAFLFIPLLVWAAVRFEQRGAATTVVLVSALVTWRTLHGLGSFAAESATQNEALLALQTFMGAIAVTKMTIAAAFSERRKSEKRFQSLIEHAPGAIALVNALGKILYASPSTEVVLGYAPEELVGTNGFLVVHPDDEAKSREALARLLALPGKIVTLELRIKKKDGSWIWAELVSRNLLREPSVGAIVTNYRDITEHKQTDQAKSEFISLASHQLRTPPTTINWYSEMLLSGDVGRVNKKQKEYLDEIYRSNQRMVGLINTLLNVTRIESGKFKVEPKPVQLEDLLEAVLDENKIEAKRKKCKLIFQKPKTKLPKIPIDSTLFSQIVNNLIANAVQYSPNRGAGCEVRVALAKRNNECVLSVEDDGIGIPKEAQPKIFEKFFRANNARYLVTDGTGLGLYTAKAIVESSGCRIWFDSEEGKGSIFYVAIPLTGMKEK